MLFFILASIGPAICIILASYAGNDEFAVVALFTVSMGLMGAFYPGMKVNALDLSTNFAGTLMAIVNGIGALSGIITPYLVGVLTPDVSIELSLFHPFLSIRSIFIVNGFWFHKYNRKVYPRSLPTRLSLTCNVIYKVSYINIQISFILNLYFLYYLDNIFYARIKI